MFLQVLYTDSTSLLGGMVKRSVTLRIGLVHRGAVLQQQLQTVNLSVESSLAQQGQSIFVAGGWCTTVA